MINWIKINRELLKHWIWQDASRLKWWLDLLFMASFEDSKQLVGARLVEIKRGQLIASISYLAKRWSVGHNTVIGFLRMLQNDNMVMKSSQSNVSIITICDYDKYQEADNLSNKLNAIISKQCEQSANCLADNLQDNLRDKFQDNLTDSQHRPYADINPTSFALAHDRFKNLEKELLADQIFWEGAAMSQKMPIERMKEFLPIFINEKIALNEIPFNYSDFRKHFYSWIRIAISKQIKLQNYETTLQNRYSKRRGVDSEARTPEDYSETL